MEKHGIDEGKVFDDRRGTTDDVQTGTDPGAGGGGPLAPFGGAPVPGVLPVPGDSPVAVRVLAIAAPLAFASELQIMEALAYALAVVMRNAGWRERAAVASAIAGRPVTVGALCKYISTARRKGYDPEAARRRKRRNRFLPPSAPADAFSREGWHSDTFSGENRSAGVLGGSTGISLPRPFSLRGGLRKINIPPPASLLR